MRIFIFFTIFFFSVIDSASQIYSIVFKKIDNGAIYYMKNGEVFDSVLKINHVEKYEYKIHHKEAITYCWEYFPLAGKLVPGFDLQDDYELNISFFHFEKRRKVEVLRLKNVDSFYLNEQEIVISKNNVVYKLKKQFSPKKQFKIIKKKLGAVPYQKGNVPKESLK